MDYFDNRDYMSYYRRCNGIIHTVKQGDTLYLIGQKHNVSVADIIEANPFVNVYNLTIGMELCIPVNNQAPIMDERPIMDREQAPMYDNREFYYNNMNTRMPNIGTPTMPQGGMPGTTPTMPQGGMSGTTPTMPQGGMSRSMPTMPQGGMSGSMPTMPQGGMSGSMPTTPQGGMSGSMPTMPQGGMSGSMPTMPQGGMSGTTPTIPQGGTPMSGMDFNNDMCCNRGATSIVSNHAKSTLYNDIMGMGLYNNYKEY